MLKTKKLTSIIASLVLVMSFLVACNNEEVAPTVPTLDAEFSLNGTLVTIDWTTDLKISAEHYGGEHVDGEGHAHIYLDGEKVAGLKAMEPFELEVPTGEHEVKIELQKNSHESYGVSAVYNVEITEANAGTEKPSLDASYEVDGSNVTINWNTDITISADHYGADHVVGEGHAHVYVNGEKVAGLKSMDAYVVEGLSAGTHVIEIALQQNDHTPYGVAYKFEVEVQ
jgi:hypothetical protein